ncbi:LOW QUALITY PROTEIN: diadenosine tetraphosphatase [Aggregatibacter actinomycetemcomitans ANH9381]|nr:LOW QUALITY PROTEIN: diadenosine tetraphosphatase [Aggregatibacter actinomycetemcomitans ANH9381]
MLLVNLINANACDLFNIPFFQFAQMKKFCPEEIPRIKADYKAHWDNWKATILQVSAALGSHFAKPHIESWTNGWQVRGHFFAYFKYEYNLNSAAILSVLLNRRRLSVSLDWHCYCADRSQINVQQYNQWLENFDFARFADFDIWRGDESEYDDVRQVNQFTQQDFTLRSDKDFWCIGRNAEPSWINWTTQFIVESIRDLLPLYEACHQFKP